MYTLKPRRHRSRPGSLPKGAYRLPTGGFVVQSKSIVVGVGCNRHRFSVRAVHREPVDVDKLAQAFIEIARSVPKAQREVQTLDNYNPALNTKTRRRSR